MRDVVELRGFKRLVVIFERMGLRLKYAITFLSGAVSVLALPPFFFWPVLFVTFPVLMVVLDGVLSEEQTSGLSKKGFFSSRFIKAGLIGWFFGFGYFVAGLYWLGHAFLVEAERFALLLPLAVLVMPAFLALFYGFAVFPASYFSRGSARFFALVLGFGFAEWLRGHILTGFPWNAIGYGLTANDGMMQFASVVGVYGLNFLAVMFFASPYLLFSYDKSGYTKYRQLLFVVIVCGLGLGTLWGYYRLSEGAPSFVEGVRLRLVQPNIPQAKKMNPEFIPWNFNELLRGSKGGRADGSLSGITHVIWPEVAVRALLVRDKYAKQEIADLLPDGTSLITGSIRIDNADNRDKVFNSVVVFDGDAKLKAIYDKMHLVPFGEYLPFQAFLESLGLEQLTRQKGGFTAGHGERLIDVPGLPPFSPLICYEIVFPNNLYDAGKRPEWLLNVTNDAWFGNSTGPHQHFHQARVRAIEEGLPVVRVSNTGISGVINAHGMILKDMPYGVSGSFDYGLPKALPGTFYSQWRWYIFPFFLGISILLMVVSNIIKTKKLYI